MKICKSRKSTHTVMNNGGFGMLTVTRNKVSVIIPEDWLFSDGRVKKYAQKKLDNMFKKAQAFMTLEN